MDPDDDSATVFLDHFGLGPAHALEALLGDDRRRTELPPVDPDDEVGFPDEDTDVLFDHLGIAAAAITGEHERYDVDGEPGADDDLDLD